MADIVDALARTVRGPVRTPADDDYPSLVAGFDLTVAHAPPIVVAAHNTDDVTATVQLAAEAGLPISVVATGHAGLPRITEGVLVSTRRLTGVEVDIHARTARVGGGATWGDVLSVATPAGLAPVCGSAPGVSVCGLVLGGGLGPIGRTVGFSSDHVRSFEVVGGDGVLLTASAKENPDLFWAMRGGRGGFGVVTSATLDLLDLPSIYGGSLWFAEPDIPALLHAYQFFTAAPVPDQLTTSVAILRLPDVAYLPPVLRGRTVATVRVAYVGGAGSAAEVQRLLDPVWRAGGSPIFGQVGELPYADIGSIHNDPTTPAAQASGGILLDRWEPATIDALLGIAGPGIAVPLVAVEIRHLGGAYGAAVAGDDAVGGRHAGFAVMAIGAPLPAAYDLAAMAVESAAARSLLDALAPWSTGGVQINFCGSVNTAAETARAWDPETTDRLAAVRHRYDPEGLFRHSRGSRR